MLRPANNASYYLFLVAVRNFLGIRRVTATLVPILLIILNI
jgi:hypothetical protein